MKNSALARWVATCRGPGARHSHMPWTRSQAGQLWETLQLIGGQQSGGPLAELTAGSDSLLCQPCKFQRGWTSSPPLGSRFQSWPRPGNWERKGNFIGGPLFVSCSLPLISFVGANGVVLCPQPMCAGHGHATSSHPAAQVRAPGTPPGWFTLCWQHFFSQ